MVVRNLTPFVRGTAARDDRSRVPESRRVDRAGRSRVAAEAL
jgi:hypothetical protein